MNEVQILKAARAIIERGWHQGDFKNKDATAYCIVGALELVDRNLLNGDSAAEAALSNTIRRAYPEKVAQLSSTSRRLTSYFNDELARTKKDVLDLFDKTLADLGGLA